MSVEKSYLTPLDGARLISSITATLFGYDEFILREISPESWLASTPTRRSWSHELPRRKRATPLPPPQFSRDLTSSEMSVKLDDARDLAAGLPRSYEVFVRGRIKFRVGRIVYLAFSRDETLMGFAFPKEEREAALETYPDKFLPPTPSDMRYQWLVVRLETIDKEELRELVFDAWRMVVPKKLASLSDDELREQGVAQRPV